VLEALARQHGANFSHSLHFMAERKRAAVVDLTDDSPPRPAPARRGHVGLSAAAPIDLDSDQEDSGAAFRPLPATAQVAPSSSGASASTSASAPTSASASTSISASAGSSSSSSSTTAGSGPSDLPPATEWLRPAAEITCPICMCETAPVEAAVLAGCAHAFCEDCIGQYVRGKVDEGKVMAEQLRCPSVDPKCEAPLLPSDVARCLKAPESVARYERLALQRCVEADEGMGCCPTAGCEYMFAFDMDNRKCAAP